MEDIELMVNKNAGIRHYAMMRAAARKRKRQLRMMALCIGLLLATTAGAVALGAIGAIHYLAATIVAIGAAATASFILGLYMGKVGKR